MARFVQAGKLDRRIAVYKPTSTLDAYNEAIEAFALYATVWAERWDVSAAEAMRAREVGAEIGCRFTVRWSSLMDAVDPTYRIQQDGRVYNITGVRALGRRDFLEIDAVARAQADLVIVPPDTGDIGAAALTWGGEAIVWGGEQITWGA